MALKLNERYPQRWDSPSNDYPQGAFKNLSELGEQDGSYLEQDWLNDYSGFFGALLRSAEMTPDGTVDTAQRSQFYDALVEVAKSAVGEEGYRKKDDNVFNGLMTIKSDNDEQGVGILLQESDGTVRGRVVATDQGLQLTQYPEDGGLQTFTFPSEGGEIGLKNDIIEVSNELNNKWDIQDTIGIGKIIREGSYGIGVRKPSLMFGTFKGVHYTHISKIHHTLLDMEHIPSGQEGVMKRMTAKEASVFLGKPIVTNGMAFKNADGSWGWDNDLISPNGIYIEGGKVISDWGSSTNVQRNQACCVMQDGSMRRYYKNDADATKMVSDGARLGVSWGAFCVWDQEIPKDLGDAPVAEDNHKSARTLLLYNGNGYYSLVITDGVTGSSGLSAFESGELSIELGAVHSFILDGGGSSQAYTVNTYAQPSSDVGTTRTLGTFFTVSEPPANEFDTGYLELESDGTWGVESASYGAPPIRLRQVGNRVSLEFNAKPFKHEGGLKEPIPRRFMPKVPSILRGIFNAGGGHWQLNAGGGADIGKISIQRVPNYTEPTYVGGVISWELGHD